VDDLLGRISSRELSEWMAYAQMEPFGEERADLRAGIIAATIANMNRDPKKRAKPFGPEEFMPKFDIREARPENSKSPEEIYALMRTWAMLQRKK
jgi:hypothetical protein